MKDEKGNALPYLEAVAITLPDKQSGFTIQGK
jgi:peptide/nickel transport system substrate-binding protein